MELAPVSSKPIMQSRRTVLLGIAVASASMLLASCAASVPAAPTTFVPGTVAAAQELRIAQELHLRLSTGYGRTLEAGSAWVAVGSVAQGIVYRPASGVFSIEGRHVHEAYLVVRGRELRGFYLPAEGAFSPLQDPVSLP